jgi:two-component system chemotaxis response regulator CheY
MANNAFAKTKILIIDDDSQIRNLLRGILLQNGYQHIFGSSNAKDGETQFITLKPDYTFLDINLPDTDGITLLKQFLALDHQAKIIMISGDSTFDNVKSSLDSGAKGFVVKPFSIKKILDNISN